MTRVYVLVEGQSEEAFVRELLQAHFSPLGIHFQPIVVSTSPQQRGGMVSYAKVRPQIVRLCLQEPATTVTTMFDLYALPADFPGRADASARTPLSGREKAIRIEASIADDIGLRNFVPNIVVHEFEALLFSGLEQFGGWFDDRVVDTLVASTGTVEPEDVNDHQATAPSKRIKAVMPSYQKSVHGPLIACDIGLGTIRAKCPHFDQWLRRMELIGRGADG